MENIDKDMMREQLNAIRSNDVENQTLTDLDRYKELFTRWKESNDLSDEESKEMTSLSEKLESIKNQFN